VAVCAGLVMHEVLIVSWFFFIVFFNICFVEN
jgi:hypothetical protein